MQNEKHQQPSKDVLKLSKIGWQGQKGDSEKNLAKTWLASSSAAILTTINHNRAPRL